ncbi:beta-ketoacyl synthase N-terminal-like domain-containing protein [Sorangium sp. So ce1000]|uniref:beta-ketoacyl synthase N-terminal-like domain-containing protein n=1 Tax=Sorangium sp. So ce1000 TaxID=3133325 RepID=UPI003F5DF7E2
MADHHEDSGAVAITGAGAISAYGPGVDTLWRAIEEGRDGIHPVTRFPTDMFSIRHAAQVPGFPLELTSYFGPEPYLLAHEFATAAVNEAWAAARVAEAEVAPERIAIVLGTLRGHRCGYHDLAETIGDQLGIAGPRLNVGSACSSAAGALGIGADLISAGRADVVIAGGSDLIVPEMFAGFYTLGLLTPEKCAPFSGPPGTTLGEGAGFLVLESPERARRRGVEILGTFLGYGLSAEAYHATTPDPSGAGFARAIVNGLKHAGLRPEAVGYVNAHGTGTANNDIAEWRGMQLALGKHADRTPISSSKSYFGHAQGAAGILEAICTLWALRHNVLPPTLHFTNPRPGAPPDPVPGNRPRPHVYDVALSTNAAFGGANTAVFLGRPDAKRPITRGRAIRVLGAGAVGPHGTTLAAMEKAIADRQPSARYVPDFRFEDVVPFGDPRGLDPSSRFLTAAASRAISDAGVKIKGEARDRSGLFVGSMVLSDFSGDTLVVSTYARGMENISANAFTRIVLNAPAGACSTILSLKGPTTTIAAGEGSGLFAIAQAAEFMSQRADVDSIVAGGVDELDRGTTGLSELHAEQKRVGKPPGFENYDREGSEGAACLLLASADSKLTERPGVPRVNLAGWAYAGPRNLKTAVDEALAMAGLRLNDIDKVFGIDKTGQWEPIAERASREGSTVDNSATLGYATSMSAALAAVQAFIAVRRGEVRRALIISSAGTAQTTALILTREAGDTQ